MRILSRHNNAAVMSADNCLSPNVASQKRGKVLRPTHNRYYTHLCKNLCRVKLIIAIARSHGSGLIRASAIKFFISLQNPKNRERFTGGFPWGGKEKRKKITSKSDGETNNDFRDAVKLISRSQSQTIRNWPDC